MDLGVKLMSYLNYMYQCFYYITNDLRLHHSAYIPLINPLGVSKAILDAAGQAVETECKNLGKTTMTLQPRADTKEIFA